MHSAQMVASKAVKYFWCFMYYALSTLFEVAGVVIAALKLVRLHHSPLSLELGFTQQIVAFSLHCDKLIQSLSLDF